MPLTRWHQLEAIYHQARALPPEERAEYVRSRAGGDESLERQVVALLEQAVSDDGFLEVPAGAAAAGPVSASRALMLVGRRLGVYRMCRR